VPEDLIDASDKELVDKAMMKLALEEKEGHEELVITCAECKVYSEIIQPAEAQFWRKKQLMLEVAMGELEEQHRNRILKNVEQKYCNDIKAISKEMTAIDAEDKSNYEDPMKDLELKIAFIKGRLANILDHIGKKYDPELGEKKLSIFQQTPTRKSFFRKSDAIDVFQIIEEFADQFQFETKLSSDNFSKLCSFMHYLQTFNENSKEYAVWKSQIENRQKRRNELEKKLGEIKNIKEVEFHQEFEKIMASSLKALRHNDDLMKHFLSDKEQGFFAKFKKRFQNCPGLEFGTIPATIQFFTCKSKSCKGAFCLKCQTNLKKDEIRDHSCYLDEIEVIYSKVVQILAEKACRKCPNCGKIGRKDLACTHITCDKCSQAFCYVCEKSLKSLGGVWGNHNNWALNGQNQNVCPSQLHLFWPEIYHDPNAPTIALERFHLKLQKEAIENYCKSLDPKKWNDMLERYFPKGIFYDDFSR
jgi:hypothetical protein